MKNLWMLLLIAISYNGYAQFSIDVNEALIKQNELSLLHDSKNQIIDLSETKGSPYYKEYFASGNVFLVSTGESLGYQMRYNIYNDEIEVKNSDDNSISSIKKSPSYSCTILNNSFRYLEYAGKDDEIKNGYFKELLKAKISLLLRYECKYKEEKIGKPPVFKVTPAKFITEKSYYLLTDEELALISTRKKKFLEYFGTHKNQINTYINSNKLDLSSDRDLIRIVTYYNSLL